MALKHISICIIIVALFISCKKGEDDPIISFRTRKARVIGKWTIVSGEEKRTFYDGSMREYTFTKDSFTAVSSGIGYSDSYSGPVIFTFEFNRDGTAKMNRYYDQDKIFVPGTWNFTGGVGKLKNKEQLLLHSSQTIGYFTDLVYSIKELRNNKLVLFREVSYSSGTITLGSVKEEYTFEQ